METNNNLPPGVTPVDTAGGNAEPITKPAANFESGASVNNPENADDWDWLVIGAGVLITVVGLSLINYFREKTYQQQADSKEKDRKIKVLQSDVENLKNELHPA